MPDRAEAPAASSRLRAGLGLALAVAVFGPASLRAEEDPWIWTGMEILGNHSVPRSGIEKILSIPVGSPYHRGDDPFWIPACAEVRKRFDFASVDCGDRPLRVYSGRKAYLIVDIVEKGREDLLRFRKPPAGRVPFGDPEMVPLSDQLDAKVTAAAIAGHPYHENAEKGYLAYTDPAGRNEDAGPLVERLAALVPACRDNLIEILRRDADAGNRVKAATLLNWVRGDLHDTLRRTIPLLDDPEPGVRNNLSRFMIQFVAQVGSKRLRHRLIDAFVAQIRRPSHGDRNKGLYNLLAIAGAWPADRDRIRRRGGEAIRYLADNSILFNVQGPARELLEILAADPRSP